MNKKEALIYSTKKHRLPRPYEQLLSSHNKEVIEKSIEYYDWEKSQPYSNTLINSVNYYLAEELPNIIENMISSTDDRLSDENKSEIDKVEFIVVHDTESADSEDTALAMSNYCVLPTTGTSWHFTVGNDGIYQQLANNIVGWHCGDGSNATKLFSTGIEATNLNYRPAVTIGEDGYYYLEGIKSTLKTTDNFVSTSASSTPPNSTSIFNSLGLATVIKDGIYHIPYVYFNGTQGVYSIKGGGSSIGIETCVNDGSDIFYTWHLTAKLVALLLVQYDLGIDRVLFHNNFSGKQCPRTMIQNNMIDTFLKMVEIEYFILKNNYEVVFTDENGNEINGRTSTLENKSYLINNKLKLTSLCEVK